MLSVRRECAVDTYYFAVLSLLTSVPDIELFYKTSELHDNISTCSIT